MNFLVKETKDSNYLVELGARYYEAKEFDLALKYYELAAEYNNRYAISDLGYIWYYGRTGERNYEKAFYYFDKARKMGDLMRVIRLDSSSSCIVLSFKATFQVSLWMSL